MKKPVLDMIFKGFSNWKMTIIFSGGASLAIGSFFLWYKAKLPFWIPIMDDENDEKEDSIMEVSIGEKTLNHSIPELPKPNWVKVGHVKELYFYPLKSGRGDGLEKCFFTKLGIRSDLDGIFRLRDRMFLVYNEKTKKSQSAQLYPKLLSVGITAIDENFVRLEVKEMTTLDLKVPKFGGKSAKMVDCVMWFGDTVAGFDCGDDAAKWISRVLTGEDSGLRIASARSLKRRILKGKSWSTFLNFYKTMRSDKDSGIFSYLASYLLLNESSLKDLSKRMGEPISSSRFRHNIMVSSNEPFEEDTWEWIKIGEKVVIRNFKPCTRCRLICINPENGEFDKSELLPVLRTFRSEENAEMRAFEHNSPKFGIYCGLYSEGPVEIGDEVFVHRPML